ncbi:hypothetical protein CLD22_23775, partial [Rubrivivax gelatinosus]|nr:hypothetical protein [Rubrivivax gelatinosus]
MTTIHKLHFIAALCVAAGCSGASAQSTGNVIISGVVDAYAGTRQLAGGERVTKVDSSGMSTSQLNFSGTEDLGGGLRGEFAIGMFFRPDGGEQGRFDGDVFWSRSAYVGIASPLGTVRLGRQGTPTFLNYIRTNAFDDSTVLGPVFMQTWVAAIAQGTQFLGTGAPPARRTLTAPLGTSDTTWNNAVAYISPSIGGTVFQAQWAPGEGGGVGSRYSVNVFHSGGPLMVGLSTEHIGDKSVPAAGPAAAVISSQTNWELTGAYAFRFGRLNAGVLRTSRDYESIAD